MLFAGCAHSGNLVTTHVLDRMHRGYAGKVPRRNSSRSAGWLTFMDSVRGNSSTARITTGV